MFKNSQLLIHEKQITEPISFLFNSDENYIIKLKQINIAFVDI